MADLARVTADRMRAGMEDDLNTAQAQGAIFDMVRAANAAIDNGAMQSDDVPALLQAVAKFEEIFAVLKEDDVPKMKAVLEWAIAEGREGDVSSELRAAVESSKVDDHAIEKKIAEMEDARRARDFKRSDSIRGELTSVGVIVENTKEGVRWRRK
jgi:cysteinyl-tRNA synthetase